MSLVLKQYNNFRFLEISQGYYFGEIELLFDEIRKYTYIADTNCELLCISKLNFQRIFFEEFREIGNKIYHDAFKRKIRTLKTYKEALKFCKRETRLHKRKKSRKIHQMKKFQRK